MSREWGHEGLKGDGTKNAKECMGTEMLGDVARFEMWLCF
jgi:hypothetical protein